MLRFICYVRYSHRSVAEHASILGMPSHVHWFYTVIFRRVAMLFLQDQHAWRNIPQPICLIVVCVFVALPFQPQIPEHSVLSSHSNLYTRTTDRLVISQSPAYRVSTTRNTPCLRLRVFSQHKSRDTFHRHLSYATSCTYEAACCSSAVR